MHCGLELCCLQALGRATVKTLLPRSNAVITRHWGLSHPLQIKPRTGNTQVIRGLLFCISARCQSLAIEKKREKAWFSVWWMGEGGKQNASQNNQPEFWWTVISAWELKRKKNVHSPHIGITDPPWFSVWSLNLRWSGGLDYVLRYRAAVEHLCHTSFLVCTVALL